MKEVILHYLWQQQAFNRDNLLTADNQPIAIQSAGVLNTNAGPDFSLARLFVGHLEWFGSVEIHIKASDWKRHGHQNDPAYDRVILHVVWEYDEAVYRSDGTLIPTLELRSRVDTAALFRATSLLNSQQPFIPCAYLANKIPGITIIAQIERAAAQRLERKAQEVLELLRRKQGDWQETAYHFLLKGFGFKTNQEGMQQLTQAFPLRQVRKHSRNSAQLANTLLHQAGLSKYAEEGFTPKLPPEDIKKQLNPSIWRYSRMRPTNFPHVRIKQVARLIHQWNSDLAWLLQIHPLDYYKQQFLSKDNLVGAQSINTLIINTVAPLLTAYGIFYRNNDYQQHAWLILRELPAENNKITRQYAKLSFPQTSALDTQGALELHQHYCTKKRCLSCSIGVAVLKKQPLFVS